MKALVVGSTGLIGSQLLQLLLEDENFSSVTSISRTPLNIIHPKLKSMVIDFSVLDTYHSLFEADVVFCCLGTTIKAAGSKEAFYQVDFEYVHAIGKLASRAGVKCFCMISAMGANASSAVFYNRVKGEIEEAIEKIGFETLFIFRPALLLGDRKEFRTGESAAKTFFKIFGWLVPKKYKPIQSIKVARSMLHASKQNQEGIFIWESDVLQGF